MAAWISADTAWAQDSGRRDRGATAGSPPARYRATSLVTQALETPALLATSRWLRPSPTTASMTYRSTPMAHLQWWALCPETCRSRGGHYVVKPDTSGRATCLLSGTHARAPAPVVASASPLVPSWEAAGIPGSRSEEHCASRSRGARLT